MLPAILAALGIGAAETGTAAAEVGAATSEAAVGATESGMSSGQMGRLANMSQGMDDGKKDKKQIPYESLTMADITSEVK